MYLFCFLQLLRETPPDGDKFAKTVEVCVIFHLDVVVQPKPFLMSGYCCLIYEVKNL